MNDLNGDFEQCAYYNVEKSEVRKIYVIITLIIICMGIKKLRCITFLQYEKRDEKHMLIPGSL